jgi:hypothetical protein
MSEAWPDLGENEQEFLAAHGEALRLARSRHAGCPSAQLIVAAKGECLPEELRAEVAEHLAACPECRMLAEDMETMEAEGLTREEKARMRAQLAPIVTPQPKLRAWTSFWNWALPVTAVAALAILAVTFTGIWRARKIQEQTSTVARQQPSPPPGIAALPLNKPDNPALLQDGGGAIIWRGGQTKGASYQEQLQAAMIPYSKDEYKTAARKLGELETKFPQKFEARFYNGICLLFLNDAAGAMRELEAAKTMAKPPDSYQVSWYLAVARQRAGQNDQALSELQQLCHTDSAYAAQACQALKSPSSR